VNEHEHDHARLLLAIVRGDWAEAEALAGPGPVAASFCDCCLESDVAAWVHARVTAGGRGELLGPPVMQRLQRIRARVRHDNLLLLARARQALACLVDAGVAPVALKGLDLIHRVHGSFDERTLDDVDLLIEPARLGAALDALQAQGWQPPPEPRRTHYIRSSHHLPLSSPGPVPVEFEIHWNLAQELRYRIDERALRERARPLEIDGLSVLRLEDHDLVAHLLLHHFTHYFDRRLKWAIDIGAVAQRPGFEWEVVLDRVRGWGATAAVSMALVHLHKMVPAWIPERVVRSLPVGGWRRALVRPLRSAHPLELFRRTRRRWVQLYLAAVLLEQPLLLPRWLARRLSRDRRRGSNPIEGLPRSGGRDEL